jgi:hypothetical protein
VPHVIGETIGLFPVFQKLSAQIGMQQYEIGKGGMIGMDFEGAGHAQNVGKGWLQILWRLRHNTVFIYGFAKNERDNIDDKELRTLREFATAWLAAGIEHFERELAAGRLQEVQ